MPQNNVFTINDKKYYINSEIIDKNEVEIDDVEEPESKTLKRKNDVDDESQAKKHKDETDEVEEVLKINEVEIDEVGEPGTKIQKIDAQNDKKLEAHIDQKQKDETLEINDNQQLETQLEETREELPGIDENQKKQILKSIKTAIAQLNIEETTHPPINDSLNEDPLKNYNYAFDWESFMRLQKFSTKTDPNIFAFVSCVVGQTIDVLQLKFNNDTIIDMKKSFTHILYQAFEGKLKWVFYEDEKEQIKSCLLILIQLLNIIKKVSLNF